MSNVKSKCHMSDEYVRV